MTQIMGFVIGFLLSVGTVLYLSSGEAWRDNLCARFSWCVKATSAAAEAINEVDGSLAKNTRAETTDAANRPPVATPQTVERAPSMKVQPEPEAEGVSTAEPKSEPKPEAEVRAVAKRASESEWRGEPDTELSPVTLKVPPQPKLWEQSDNPIASTRPAPRYEPLSEPFNEPFNERQSELSAPAQHVFWPAFNNSVSASGFASLVTEKTGLDVMVRKNRPGNYTVTIAYRNPRELERDLALIEASLGVHPLPRTSLQSDDI